MSEGTALSDAQPAGVLYLPAGKVKSDQKRGASKTPEKKRNETYQMNGVLLRDAHLLTLMEQNGEGIYVPGKLDAKGELDTKKGTFLTQEQMRNLRKYVLEQLVDMAERVYHGEIDALPLELPKEDPCKFCAFSNICGNSELCRQRIPYGDSRMQEKKMMEILEELAEEENN